MKKFFLFAIAIFCCSFISFAQWYNPDKVPKKAGELYGKAFEQAENGNYALALKMMDEAMAMYPKFVDVPLSKGGIYSSMHQYQSAVTEYNKGFAMDSIYANEYLLPYSIALAGNGQFENALDAVNKFLRTPNLGQSSTKAGLHRKMQYEFAINENKKNREQNYVFSSTNMGSNINSTALEYYPSLPIEGNKIIFTRRENGDEDFYESNFENGAWTNAKPLAGKINTSFNEGAQSVSQDNEWLVYAGCNYPEGAGSCDLYLSTKNKNGEWNESENLGRTINTEFWESSPSLSPDKQSLYFSSDRPGGRGGRDIWVSHRDESGRWMTPVNLGPTVNTEGDESCPFIHADNKTLFFNSNGHLSYGMSDLYMTQLENENKWTKPKNLGYPINTIDDEGSLVVAADGKTAYYASDGKGTLGGLDLFTFQLRNDIRATPTSWVKGNVYDLKTKVGLPATIELTDLETGNIVSKVRTDESGDYLVTLPAGKDYAFFVNRKDYLFFSENFKVLESSSSQPQVLNIPLQKISTGSNVILKNIFFESKSYLLADESQTELNKIVKLLNDNPKMKIEIGGHTDNVGTPKDNLLLSSNRAKSVVNYLTSKGISATRLIFKGFGETKPIAKNDTEEGKALNRRTELKVLSN